MEVGDYVKLVADEAVPADMSPDPNPNPNPNPNWRLYLLISS